MADRSKQDRPQHRSAWRSAFVVTIASVGMHAGQTFAQEPNFANPAAPPPSEAFAQAPSPLGDLWGLRKTLNKFGLTIGGIYTGSFYRRLTSLGSFITLFTMAQ
jgi:hypothetical protein